MCGVDPVLIYSVSTTTSRIINTSSINTRVRIYYCHHHHHHHHVFSVLYCILFCLFLISVPLLSIVTTATTRIQTNWIGLDRIELYCCGGDENELIVPRLRLRLRCGYGSPAYVFIILVIIIIICVLYLCRVIQSWYKQIGAGDTTTAVVRLLLL